MSRTASAPQPGALAVADAQARLLATVQSQAPGATEIGLDQALGRILAADLVSGIDVPAWPNSAMDGYCLRAADTGEGTVLPISQRLPAGAAPSPLAPGTAARIFTGAPIPDGADTVIMQEDCTETGSGVRCDRVPATGANIRAAGEDIRRGDTVIRAGRRLRPQDIGLAASIGIDALSVRPRLRVAILATGDELVAPGNPLGPGQIYNSNAPLAAALATQIGCEPLPAVRVADTAEATRSALREAAADADLILTSGGVSVGDEDHVKSAVAELGSLELWKVAMKPGKPLAFGRVGDTPLIGLPGNPVSLFVTFLLFAAPAIRHIQGRGVPLPPPIPIAAGFERAEPGKRDEYLRVRLDDGRLVPYPSQGSGVLSSSAWADGLAHVPAGSRVAPGTPLDYYSLDRLLN